MSKLPDEAKFIDLSDYGRPLARIIASQLRDTPVCSVHITFAFLISGLIAAFCIWSHLNGLAFVFLLLKSVLDAADGELAREKKQFSYTGRFLDSIFDFITNFVVLFSVYRVADASLTQFVLAFLAVQLQGTVYNYYHVIYRNMTLGGDSTSRIEEKTIPEALPLENQSIVTVLFLVHRLLYYVFDKIVLNLDAGARTIRQIPRPFMSAVSIYGLGFQLFLIGLLLVCDLVELILPFLIYYSVFIVAIIGIRKLFVSN